MIIPVNVSTHQKKVIEEKAKSENKNTSEYLRERPFCIHIEKLSKMIIEQGPELTFQALQNEIISVQANFPNNGK